MSRNGLFTIEFLQDMMVPSFLTIEKNLDRALQITSLRKEEISVTRDLVDIDIIINSDIDPANIHYSVSLQQWTKRKFSLQFDFENPLMISKAEELDVMVVRLRNATFFVTQLTQTPIDISRMTMARKIPR